MSHCKFLILALFALLAVANGVGLGGSCAAVADCTFAGQYCNTGIKLGPLALDTLSSGTDHTSDTYTDVDLSGTGANVSAKGTVVVTGGAVTSVTVTTAGSAYTALETITIAQGDIGGGAAAVTFKLVASENDVCVVCPANSYCAGTGTATTCANGQTSPAGSTAAGDCIFAAGHECVAPGKDNGGSPGLFCEADLTKDSDGLANNTPIGALYCTGNTSGTATTTSGSGTGGTVATTCTSSVVAITFEATGTGYAAGDTITIPAGTGGTSAPITITLAAGDIAAGVLKAQDTTTAPTAGAACTTATYSDLDTTSSGSGTGAKVDIVCTDSEVSKMVLTASGSGYAAGDTIIVATGDVAGTSANIVVTLAAADLAAGVLKAQAPTNPVASCPVGAYTLVALTASTGNGTGGVATVTCASDAVTKIVVTTVGSNYKSGDVISMAIPNTSAATKFTLVDADFLGSSIKLADATLTGKVAATGGTTAGTYYNIPLTSNSGSGALATVTVDATTLTKVTVTTGGTGYVAAETITIAQDTGVLGQDGVLSFTLETGDVTAALRTCTADSYCPSTDGSIIACPSGNSKAGSDSVSDCVASVDSWPTSAPTFAAEGWGQITWDKRRHRNGGLCENHCSNHGTCEKNSNCKCFTGLDGEPEWTGPDCSLRTCPRDFAWVGDVINSNNLHPWVECSNKGSCDRKSGTCKCFDGYDGVACQRSTCPDNCNDRGTCWPERHLAIKASRTYSTPWDAMKHVGCFCDAGYRGPACELQECPSGTDPLDGYGNEAGRDCSGRGICDFSDGTCTCFAGFYGTHCQHQTTIF